MWKPYDSESDLEKDIYEIRTHAGNEYKNMYPNGGGFHRTVPCSQTPSRVPFEDVSHVKFQMTLEQQQDSFKA